VSTTDLPTLPFGRHKHKPLAEVPEDYLLWLLGACRLSSGLRADVAGDLARRGIEAPPPPAPAPIPQCRTCGDAGHRVFWFVDRLERRRLRAECARCRRLLTFPPCVQPYTTMADAAVGGRS
jgi:hypothetical protein